MVHRKNKIVQNHLYDRMDDLLELDVAIPELAEVLTEVRESICKEFIEVANVSMHIAYNRNLLF